MLKVKTTIGSPLVEVVFDDAKTGVQEIVEMLEKDGYKITGEPRLIQ